MLSWITRAIAQGGAWSVFLLMLVENVVPPIPSELIMPFAGFASARGEISALAAVIAGTVGSVAGAWVWFEIGRWLGRERLQVLIERHGRWLAITPEELARADRWFRRRGPWALLVGRCLPGVRGVICIPAGVTRMDRRTFALACTLGSLAWCAILVAAGRSLGARYAQVEAWLSPVSAGFLGLCIVAYLSRMLRPR